MEANSIKKTSKRREGRKQRRRPNTVHITKRTPIKRIKTPSTIDETGSSSDSLSSLSTNESVATAIYPHCRIVFLHDLLDKTQDALSYILGISPNLRKATQQQALTFILYHQAKEGSEIVAKEHLEAIKEKIQKRMTLQHTSIQIKTVVEWERNMIDKIMSLKPTMIVARTSKTKVGKIPKMLYRKPLQTLVLLVPYSGYRPRLKKIVMVTHFKEREFYMKRTLEAYVNFVKAYEASTIFLECITPAFKSKANKPKLEKTMSLSTILKSGITRLSHAYSTRYKPSEETNTTPTPTITIPTRPTTSHTTRTTTTPTMVSPSMISPTFTSPLLEIDTRITFKRRQYDSLTNVHRFSQHQGADMIAIMRTNQAEASLRQRQSIDQRLFSSKTKVYSCFAYPVLILPGVN